MAGAPSLHHALSEHSRGLLPSAAVSITLPCSAMRGRDVGIGTLGEPGLRRRAICSGPRRMPSSRARRICSSAARRRFPLPTAKAATACFWPSTASTCWRWTSRRRRLAKSQALAKERGVTLSAPSRPISTPGNGRPRRFDVVAAIFFQFCEPPMRTRVFANIKRALETRRAAADGGLQPEQLEYKTGGPSEAENLYTRKLLEDSFADFSSVEIEDTTRDPRRRRARRHVGADRPGRTQIG